VRTAVIGVRRRRAGRALTPAEHVGAHDEVAVGVERATRPDQVAPPPRGRVAVDERAGRVTVAGERVADEDRVRPVGVERAPRLVGDRDVAQRAPTFEHERPVGCDLDESPLAWVITRSPRAGCGQHRRMHPAVHASILADASTGTATYWSTT